MLDQQLAELIADEGQRLVVYDDATGRPITPQSFVRGHPTIGVGRALDVHGISETESHALFGADVDFIEATLSAVPWFAGLDPVRRGVLTNLAFNLGVRGIQTFTHLIADLEQAEHDLAATLQAAAAGDFAKAATELLQSKWATQVQGTRRDRLIAQLKSGVLGPSLQPIPNKTSLSIASVPIQTDDSAVTDALNQAELDRINAGRETSAA